MLTNTRQSDGYFKTTRRSLICQKIFGYAGSDTRPTKLDRKTLNLGQQRHSSVMSGEKNKTSSNARNKATVQDDRVVVQDVRDRYNVNNQGRPFQRNNARENVVAGNVGGQNRVGNMNPGQAKPIMCYNFAKGEQFTNFDEDVDDLALNVDHVFEADQCDAFDSDVDEAPTTQTMFMVNLSSEDPIYDEKPWTSYDSNTSVLRDIRNWSGCLNNGAKFELTDRERKIDEQMRIIILLTEIGKESSLNRKLHSDNCNFVSTLNHHKIMREQKRYI
ncbi:hypothetical protein Tco_0907936 [Tanacetum coccineum]|uniref:Integrase, catalytic region, zinc finger, CCHC-type, peptidase aspartic, catalytic n=1 Tax=Tanacetum coccineum TaxID=301880 RepID=A0ABQ5CP70_9ASTR